MNILFIKRLIMFRFPLCLLVVHDLCVFVIANMLGPADLAFNRLEHCDPKCTIVDFWIEQRKYNRSIYVLDFTIRNPYPIDDTVTLELKGSMKKEGGFKPGSFYYKDIACKALDKMFGDMFLDILNRAGTEQCPLPAGDYGVLDFYFDNEKFTVPQIWGEYKMEIFLYKEEELAACYVAYYDMVPKN